MTCDGFAAKAKLRLLIQSPTETGTSLGGRTVSWADVGTYWGYMEPATGREVYAQDATQARATVKATIRYQSVLKDARVISDYRLSYDGRLYGIVGVQNLDRDMKTEGRAYQVLLLTENGPDVNG